MLLETIALLLPFIVLGLIGLFVAILLIEVQKQHKTTRKRVRENSLTKSSLNWIVYLIIGGVFLHCIVNFIHLSFFITLILFAVAALENSSQEQSPQQNERYQRVPVVPPRTPQSPSPIKHASTSPAPRRTLNESHLLRIKLMAMVGEDVGTADRLLQQCQKNNPGMETEWYFDKVIYDLIRDRR